MNAATIPIASLILLTAAGPFALEAPGGRSVILEALRSRDVQEKQRIERRRQQLEDEVQSGKERERQHRITLHDIAEQLAHAQYLATIVAADGRQRDSVHASLRLSEQQVAALQQTLDSHDENLAKTRADLAQLEQELEQHAANVTTVTAKIPQMEADKKAAVAARDFKKAATASNEIKALQQSKTDSETAMEELRVKVDRYRVDLGSADETKSGIAAEMKRLDEETDRRRLQFLLGRESKLSRRAARARELLSRDGGVHTHSQHLQREVETVDVELRWIQVEIREVRSKYGWQEGEVRASAADEEDETEEADVVSHVNDPSPFDSFKSNSGTPNGVATLGVPVIAPRKSSSASASGMTPSPSASHIPAAAAAEPTPPAKPTQQDVEGLRASLAELRQTLATQEEELAAAEAAENFERAAELQDAVTGQRTRLDEQEAKLHEMEGQLQIDAAGAAEVEHKQDDDPFAEED